MSVKSIILKVVIGIAVVALLLSLMWFLTRPNEEAAEEVITVYSSDEEISSIDIVSKEDSFTLVKTDEKWQMEGMEGLGLIGNLPETVARSFSDITSPMLVSENTDELSSFGLLEPSAKVTLNFKDHSETFLIGNESGDYYYFKRASEDKIYIVSYDTLYLIFTGKMGFLSKTAVSIDQSTITRVSYRNVIIERDGESWWETAPYNIAADESTVTGRILPGVSSISALEIFSPDECAFSEYERVFIDSGDESVALRLSKEDNGKVLLKVGNADYIYSVSKSSLSFLDISGFEAASKYIAPIPITEIASLELVSPEKTDVLTIEAPSSEAPVFYKNGEEADETNFRDFYQALMSLTFTGTGAASGNAEYKISFEKENGDRVDISFIPYSEAEYAVRINGKTNFIIAKKPVRDVFSYINNIKTV